MLRENGHARAWMLLVIGLVAIGLGYFLVPAFRAPELVLASAGGVWALSNFLHQQELAHTRFFFELFNRFNERYDKINNDLQRIAESEALMTSEERKRLIDYFNLCAEEYMFRRRGYIPDDVWRAWSNGMRWYAEKQRVMDVWDREVETGSYYGFDLRALLQHKSKDTRA